MKVLRMIAGITCLLAGVVVAGTASDSGFFPYAKGRYWLYDGTVRFVRNQAAVEKKITGWKSEVLDTVEAKDFRAALLKGRPGDLAWYQEGRRRGVSIVILTSKGVFLDLGEDAEASEKFARIKSTGKLPPGFVEDDNVFFKTSMKVGDRFGDPEQTKLGPRYCWVVQNIMTEKPDPPVKGVAAEKEFVTYILDYPTSPDRTIVKFAVGLGVTSFQYTHHGTPGDCEMHLVETGNQASQP